jgi:hypothetical protein
VIRLIGKVKSCVCESYDLLYFVEEFGRLDVVSIVDYSYACTAYPRSRVERVYETY